MINQDNKLDLLKTEKLVDIFLEEESKTIKSIKKEKRNISKAISKIISRIQKGGRVIYIGAGTSGRLGVLDASECKPTFSTDIFQAIIAGGKEAIFRAKEDVEDDKLQAIKDCKKLKLNRSDVLIGVSASGETPYTVASIKFAKRLGASTVGVCSNPSSTLAKIARYRISPLIKKEIISGSSRLKSGTAQKIILNMISSISMIKLGKVYGRLMIDVQPKNKKLIKRAISIISDICKLPFRKSKELFYKSKMHTKAAIVMHYRKCNLKTAQELLKAYSYNLRKVIG